MTARSFLITACRACGGTALTWATSIANRSEIQQGRLNTRDVECLFYLGCDSCSETQTVVSADRVADLLNDQTAARIGAAETDAA